MQSSENMLTAAENKPQTYGVINVESLTFSIKNHETARNDRKCFIPSYNVCSDKEGGHKPADLLVHQFPVYANCLLLILNHVRRRLQF